MVNELTPREGGPKVIMKPLKCHRERPKDSTGLAGFTCERGREPGDEGGL